VTALRVTEKTPAETTVYPLHIRCLYDFGSLSHINCKLKHSNTPSWASLPNTLPFCSLLPLHSALAPPPPNTLLSLKTFRQSGAKMKNGTRTGVTVAIMPPKHSKPLFAHCLHYSNSFAGKSALTGVQELQHQTTPRAIEFNAWLFLPTFHSKQPFRFSAILRHFTRVSAHHLLIT
jgi:hypothetical protein